MAKTLGEIREYVRTFLDLEDEDMPDLLIDTWVREYLTKITNFQQRWPFYRTTVEVALDPLDGGVLSVPMRTILSVSGAPDGSLVRMSTSEAERQFFWGDGIEREGRPVAFSEWGRGELRVWPKPDQPYTLQVRGYREPQPLSAAAGSTPDVPEEFHEVLLLGVMVRAYQHQDYPEEAAATEQAFDKMLALLTNTELQSSPEEILVFGGGSKHRRIGMRDPMGPGLGQWGGF